MKDRTILPGSNNSPEEAEAAGGVVDAVVQVQSPDSPASNRVSLDRTSRSIIIRNSRKARGRGAAVASSVANASAAARSSVAVVAASNSAKTTASPACLALPWTTVTVPTAM